MDFPLDMERLKHYRHGGHHPVHLGDLLNDGRYRVLHKISSGSGGRANTWLVRDLKSEGTVYVSVKILNAKDSRPYHHPELLVHSNEDPLMFAENIRKPLRTFKTFGPNGMHLCFVYPALRPWMITTDECWLDLPLHGASDGSENVTRRRVIHQAVRALASLHEMGTCHGGKSWSDPDRRLLYRSSPLTFSSV